MKKIILTTILVTTSINAFAALNGVQNLSCHLEHLQPNDYKATLKGPNNKNKYELILKENYFGYIFKNTYSLSVKSEIELASAKAYFKEINIINNKHLVEIKTDKVGPLTLICD